MLLDQGIQLFGRHFIGIVDREIKCAVGLDCFHCRFYGFFEVNDSGRDRVV